jgi:hypothetical protein
MLRPDLLISFLVRLLALMAVNYFLVFAIVALPPLARRRTSPQVLVLVLVLAVSATTYVLGLAGPWENPRPACRSAVDGQYS